MTTCGTGEKCLHNGPPYCMGHVCDRVRIMACPTPVYHETHRYCPSCPWTERSGTTDDGLPSSPASCSCPDRAALLDVAEAAVEMLDTLAVISDDARIEWLDVQVDRDDLAALREALQRLDGGQATISDAASGGSESGKA